MTRGRSASEVTLLERLSRLRPGARAGSSAEAKAAQERTKLEVVEEQMVLTSPEGQRHALPLDKLLECLEPHRPPAPDLVWPRGARAVRRTSGGFVIAHETPPAVHSLRWSTTAADPDDEVPVSYRDVRIAFPYVIVVAGMHLGARGDMLFPSQAEAYFSNQPLCSVDDPLHYAPLLNVVRAGRSDRNGGALVCLGGLDPRVSSKGGDLSQRLHQGLSAIVGHFLYSGFNEDFERTGRVSTFNDSRAKPDDPRLATIEAWEKATADDPRFVLDVAWTPTGRTLEHAIKGVASEQGIQVRGPVRNGTLQRLILTRGKRLPEPDEKKKGETS